MAKLPNYRSILVQDIPNAPDWISSLLYPLNSFNGSTYQALNKSLTVKDNLAAFYQTVTVTTNSSGQPTNTVKFQNSLSSKLNGLIVINVQGNTQPTTPVQAFFSENNSQVTVNTITGLSPNQSYSITFRCE